MSNINELLKDKNNVLGFDVDGVLAKMEWGSHNHYELDDEAWTKICEEGKKFYTQDCVCKKMQSFLSDKNMDKIFHHFEVDEVYLKTKKKQNDPSIK